MEELDFVELRKKISEILFDANMDQATARTHPISKPDIMFINLLGWFARDQSFWERNLIVIITHENLHNVLYRLAGLEATIALDNLWKSTTKSMFFLDGNWKWFR